MVAIVVRSAPLDSTVASGLIGDLDEYLNGLYRPQDNFLELDPASVDGRDGIFLVAWQDDVPAGCGAVRRISNEVAEIKRMWVVPTARGQGIARQVLAELELWSLRRGYGALVLETGLRQPEAIGLYRSAGFVTVPCWGAYAGSGQSVCYRKELGGPIGPPQDRGTKEGATSAISEARHGAGDL